MNRRVLVGKNWQEIRNGLMEGLDYKRSRFFFSDREVGIKEGTVQEGILGQRYVLQEERDFSHILIWRWIQGGGTNFAERKA